MVVVYANRSGKISETESGVKNRAKKLTGVDLQSYKVGPKPSCFHGVIILINGLIINGSDWGYTYNPTLISRVSQGPTLQMIF